MGTANARTPLVGMGMSMIGPTLLEYGSDAQKAEHLPKIIRGEVQWCQGYSEPNAGSDLAALSSRAEDQGDHFVINGQKFGPLAQRLRIGCSRWLELTLMHPSLRRH